MRDSGKDPKALEARPPFYEWMQEYTIAFNVLSATRSYGMGANPIQLTEILAYLKLFGSSDDTALIRYVLAMDRAYLETKATLKERQDEQRAQADKRRERDGQRPGANGGRRR